MEISSIIAPGRVGLGSSGELLVNLKNGEQSILSLSKTTTITSTQVLALNATPQTVIAAPGAGLAILPRLVVIYKIAATAYAGIAAGENLVLKFTDASGAQCSSVINSTGFLDQATAQIRYAGPPGSTGTTVGDVTPVANSPVVLHLLVGEITTGTAPLRMRVYYDLIQVPF